MSAPTWDVIAAELVDTVASQRQLKTKRACIYCATPTTAISRVCPAHSDLPTYDPNLNVQAGRFSQASPRDPRKEKRELAQTKGR